MKSKLIKRNDWFQDHIFVHTRRIYNFYNTFIRWVLQKNKILLLSKSWYRKFYDIEKFIPASSSAIDEISSLSVECRLDLEFCFDSDCRKKKQTLEKKDQFFTRQNYDLNTDMHMSSRSRRRFFIPQSFQLIEMLRLSQRRLFRTQSLQNTRLYSSSEVQHFYKSY